MAGYARSPRGMQVHILTGHKDGDLVIVEAYAAKGGPGSRATHETAADRAEQLMNDGTCDTVAVESKLVK